MRSARRMFVVTVLALVPSGVFAQDFTGGWELIGSAGNATSLSPLSDRGSIVHSAETITLRPAQARSSQQGDRTYRLDGAETRYSITTASGDVRSYIASLRRVSAALVITTTALPRTPTESAWDSMITLSLNGKGELVVQVVGPNLWPSGTSSAHQFVYRKTAP